MIDEKKIEEAKEAFISNKTILDIIALNEYFFRNMRCIFQ